MDKDDSLVAILGDIGVFGFRYVFSKFPERIYNIGICEQAVTSLAAGLSKVGLIPVVHSIAPFVVERCFEQLKVDFGYQKLGGNFVSIGASYDYAGLGCTHHCPGDVALLKTIPGMEIVVPGTSSEFDALFNESYNNDNPTYFRLSEFENKESNPVKFGKANIIKKGNLATIIVIGPLLDFVIEATKKTNVTILYYTTISPFDSEMLLANVPSEKILLFEPYYFGGLSTEIHLALKGKSINIKYIGVPHNFLTNYGSYDDQREYLGLTIESIQKQINDYLNEETI
jgi:transketolase